MSKLDYWCQMCGAAPGELCKVISGSGKEGDQPGDVRLYPHWHRSRTTKPEVLVPDEPSFDYQEFRKRTDPPPYGQGLDA